MESLVLPREWYDATKLKDLRQGGFRYYYWKHERHFRPPEVNKISGRATGTCWHSGLDALWEAACGKEYDPDIVGGDVLRMADIAMEGFLTKWRELELPFDQESLLLAKARIPDTFYQMYKWYSSIRADFFRKVTLLGVEIPFIVPIIPGDSTVAYVGLIDKLIRHNDLNKIIPIDHKSTTRYDATAGIRYDYLNNLQMSGQPQGYAYATSLLRKEEIDVVYFDISLVHRNKKEETSRHDVHKILHVDCASDMRNLWLQDTQRFIELIRNEREKLKAGKYAFPRSCDTCANYGICAYQDLCTVPVKDLRQVRLPVGWQERAWNPITLQEED